MAIKYKGLELIGTYTYGISRYDILGTHIKNLLWPMGDIKIVGSFAKKKALIRGSDIDVVIFTGIDDYSYLVSHVKNILPLWAEVCTLDLDIFLFGNFTHHILKEEFMYKDGRCIKCTLRFNKPEKRLWDLYIILIRKFWRYLLS